MDDGNSGSIIGDKINNRNINLSNNIKKIIYKAGFLISKASLAFPWLKKAFTKTPILYHFNSKYYIMIETDTSGYTISGVLSQLTTKRA